MENLIPARPIPVPASRPARWLASLGLLAVALAMSVPIYGSWLSGSAGRDFQSRLVLLWGVWALAASASALILRRTGSLWGPVLAHAFADVLFLLAAFGAGVM